MYEQTDDMSTALTYMLHIDYPCVDNRTGINNREFWLRLARVEADKLTNPHAKKLLEAKISEYSSKTI